VPREPSALVPHPVRNGKIAAMAEAQAAGRHRRTGAAGSTRSAAGPPATKLLIRRAAPLDEAFSAPH
jgi:hypothetical protein